MLLHKGIYSVLAKYLTIDEFRALSLTSKYFSALVRIDLKNSIFHEYISNCLDKLDDYTGRILVYKPNTDIRFTISCHLEYKYSSINELKLGVSIYVIRRYKIFHLGCLDRTSTALCGEKILERHQLHELLHKYGGYELKLQLS